MRKSWHSTAKDGRCRGTIAQQSRAPGAKPSHASSLSVRFRLSMRMRPDTMMSAAPTMVRRFGTSDKKTRANASCLQVAQGLNHIHYRK